MRKFETWQEAEEWAQDNDLFLEPTGSYTGDDDERMVTQYLHDDTNRVEMWTRMAEVSAINERKEVVIGVREYFVMVYKAGQHENLIHVDDIMEAEMRFDLEVKYMTPIPHGTIAND